jgi:hypothetical protein
VSKTITSRDYEQLKSVGGKRVLTPVQEAALARLAATSWPLNIGRLNRDDLYQERLDRYSGALHGPGSFSPSSS